MIDRIREQIQKRLDELGTEMDRLRTALLALDSDAAPGTPKARVGRPPRAASPERPATARKSTSARPATRGAASASRRTAPGATKASVLAALAGGEAMTASEVAAKTGLGRATVSTTLSKLASSGEVEKAERGYRAPAGAKAAA